MNEKDNLDYNAFLETKKAQRIDSGFDVEESQLNPQLFPFQRYCVRRALKNGKFALFEDCGLGKSIQQLEWAKQVIGRINKPVLILAPLAVVGQTIKEGIKFGYNVTELNDMNDMGDVGIYITNYENMDNIFTGAFGGIVLDESSILKRFQGKTKQLIIDLFRNKQ